MIVVVAVHIVFAFVLNLAVHAKVVDHITPKQETTQNEQNNR